MMPVQIVVDISSDEEDNAAKSSTKTRSTGEQPTDCTRTFAKSPSRTPLTADKPTLSPPETAGCSESLANVQPKTQSTVAIPTQIEQKVPKDQVLPAPQTTTITSTPSTLPLTPTADDPPKPTPLDINEFRHLVSAGSVPAKDAPLIMSIQPAPAASNGNNKRKAPDTLDTNPSRRPRPSPLPPTPYTGTSEHPVPPKRNNNSLLWSVPAYNPPSPPHDLPSSSPSQTPTAIPPAAPKQPSIPNIHAPPTPPPHPARQQQQRRRRESKWTGAQLANLASALEAAFAPAALEAFAARNRKTGAQVGEAFGFLVGGRIWEYCDEEGGKGRGRVARRFEREMRAYRKNNEKTMRQVHRREAGEGHWASEGMPEGERKGKGKGVGKGKAEGKGKKVGGVLEGKGKGKKVGGVLEGVVGG